MPRLEYYFRGEDKLPYIYDTDSNDLDRIEKHVKQITLDLFEHQIGEDDDWFDVYLNNEDEICDIAMDKLLNEFYEDALMSFQEFEDPYRFYGVSRRDFY